MGTEFKTHQYGMSLAKTLKEMEMLFSVITLIRDVHIRE